MFFGGFLALLYVATNRLSFVVIGLLAVRARRLVRRHHVRARPRPRRRLAAPVRPAALQQASAAATSSPSRCSPRPTAGCSARASAQAAARTSPGGGPLLPAPQTDMIYAVITNELGLFGACAVLLIYLLFVARGFKTAHARARLVLEAAGDRADARSSRCRCS